MEKYVVSWRVHDGVERPVVIVSDDKYLAHHPTKAEAVAACLKSYRRHLDRARESVLRHERYVAELEALAAEVATP